jgi:hypothetical protein
MALAYQNTGDFAKAVYGDASQHHAGANGAIAMASPSAPVALKGGNKSQRNKSQRNKSQKQKKGGKNQRKNQRKNKSQRKN